MNLHKCPVAELEDLPPGWIMKEYDAGICFYIHEPTNVISTTRPYMLGPGSIKKHKLCANAIPCLDYMRPRNKTLDDARDMNVPSDKLLTDQNSTVNINAETKEESETEIQNAVDDLQTKTKADENSTVHINAEAKEVSQTETLEFSNVPDSSKTECRTDSVQKHKENFVTHEEASAYFKKLYRHRTIMIRKFNSWKMKRAFVHKQKCKNKITKNVPAAPEGMIVIKVPKLNSRTNKIEMSDWTLNPSGKSNVCLLHEYLQRAVKTHPIYVCKELENAKTPYMATIKLNNMQYGSGIGSSKKVAKSEAAKATLEILIPQLKYLWKNDEANTESSKVQDEANYTLFDSVPILDSNVSAYCESLNEVQPFAMLQSCVDDRIIQSMETVGNENIFTLKVGKYSASVRCASKYEGRQRASQKILQKLHPQVHYLGSLLRLYGNAVMKGIKEKKSGNDEQEATKRKLNDDAPNIEVLRGLRETMNTIYADRKHLLEKGQFEAPANIDETVMKMYQEMKAYCKKAKRKNETTNEISVIEDVMKVPVNSQFRPPLPPIETLPPPPPPVEDVLPSSPTPMKQDLPPPSPL